MFLIDAIKPIIEKKSKACFFVTFLGRGVGRVQNKTSFVSIRVRFTGGNKNIIQKKRENIFRKISISYLL